ncbi:Ig-like domain-containing protein [Kitasatospora sp. NPDC127116]|uniref:Ig-like domain-containing protein n=1 Tax=Kitasatospora sp. NPDC127116 TaxID=3345367 RepID=UPI00363A9583
MSRQFSLTAAALAVLATGLLTTWNAPLSVARQSPDTWSAEHRAVLPSGLSVRFDLDAAPGTGVTAAPGELADRSAAGLPAARYADGMRPGDPAQTFDLAPDRPQADGSWRTVGTLRLDFSRPVRNPRLHLSGLAALATGNSGSTSTATRLTVTGGSPAAPALVDRTDWPGWTVEGNVLAPASPDGASDGEPGSAAEGSLELAGTVRTAVFRVEQRSVARAGSTTAPPVLHQAYTVTVDEGLGTAPQDYGNASHVVTDLFLGADAAGPARTAGSRSAKDPGSGPLVRPDHGAAPRSPFDGPRAGLQPGRGEYQGADPAIAFPADAAIGHYYRLTVPVAVGDQPATLAGWIDFDRTGRFDPAERVQTEVPPGADTATLEWTVPAGAASGGTWARLRIGRDGGQLVSSGGFADSGQVTDQRIELTVGAARPEIAEPVDGAVLADARPRIGGGGAVSGATVEVVEGDTALCKAKVLRGGDWSCRPDTGLAPGPHALTPVETTTGGVVLRGEPVGVSVKSVPPGAPALTVPAYTNDPGLRLTGTGEAGSTVSVVERGSGDDLCITGVPADGRWSCLPVENLTDGKHLLTPVAVDAAGNRTAGPPVELVVDTGLPQRPVLTSPAPGETVRVSRPKLAGRAEPGGNVLVTVWSGASSEAERRTVLCGATAAFDGSWSCTANRDLTDGDQWLLVTATDRAGNEVAAEPVPVRVAAAGAVPDPAASSPAASGPVASSPAASGSVSPSPTAQGSTAQGSTAVGPTASAPAAEVSSPVAGSPTRSASASARPSPTTAATTVSASGPAASPAAPGSAVPGPVASGASAVPSNLAGSGPSAQGSAVASPSPSVAAVPSEVPAALPIVVPSAGARPVTAGPVVASSVAPKSRPDASAPAPATVTTASVASTGLVAPIPSTTATVSPAPAPAPAPADGVGALPAAVAAVQSAPSPAGTAGAAAGTAGAADSAGAVAEPAEPAEPAESIRSAARPLAAPPAEPSQGASGRPGEAGRRGWLAGVLLVLTGLGLITRRVFARRAGAPRR